MRRSGEPWERLGLSLLSAQGPRCQCSTWRTQYCYGARGVTLEIPGGIVDPGESPREAALPELQEETGYRAAHAVALGWVNPNPALQGNRCWTFLADDLTHVGGVQGDGSESIDVVRIPLQKVPALFADGSIRHALVVTAFHLYRQHIGKPLL